LEQPRILIVDDEPFNLDLLEQELELLGYGSVRAVDGRNALERLQSEAFDLVLLDVMMPGIDGFGVLERMKSHPKWQHIPVIMISAMTDMASVVRCITNGAEDYLPKPFEPILLQARVGASLERKRSHDREIANLELIELERQRADELDRRGDTPGRQPDRHRRRLVPGRRRHLLRGRYRARSVDRLRGPDH